MYYREADPASSRQKSVLPPIGGGDVGDGVGGGRGVCPKEAEYGRTVYCDATDYGTLWVRRMEAVDVCFKSVV